MRSVLEWENDDSEHYHVQRMAVDNMQCSFKTIYLTEQIDSVRYLLESKKTLLLSIVVVLWLYRSGRRYDFNSVWEFCYNVIPLFFQPFQPNRLNNNKSWSNICKNDKINKNYGKSVFRGITYFCIKTLDYKT